MKREQPQEPQETTPAEKRGMFMGLTLCSVGLGLIVVMGNDAMVITNQLPPMLLALSLVALTITAAVWGGIVAAKQDLLRASAKVLLPFLGICLLWIGYIGPSRDTQVLVDGKELRTARFLWPFGHRINTIYKTWEATFKYAAGWDVTTENGTKPVTLEVNVSIPVRYGSEAVLRRMAAPWAERKAAFASFWSNLEIGILPSSGCLPPASMIRQRGVRQIQKVLPALKKQGIFPNGPIIVEVHYQAEDDPIPGYTYP